MLTIWVSLHSPNIQVRLGAAGQVPCFLFPSLSPSACQLLSMCANCLKRPKSLLCQEPLWQTRWTKTWQLQSDSLGDIYQLWRAGKTVEWQWNKTLYILITSSAPCPNWNDWKQHSALTKTVNKASFCTVSLDLLPMPFLLHSSPPLTGRMCCSAVL